MHYYSYKEILEVLNECEANYLSKIKTRSPKREEKQYLVSAVYTTREIKKHFKKDWIKKCQK